MTLTPYFDDDDDDNDYKDDIEDHRVKNIHDDNQVDCDGEGQREEREEREMILTTVQLRRASIMDTLVPQVQGGPN